MVATLHLVAQLQMAASLLPPLLLFRWRRRWPLLVAAPNPPELQYKECPEPLHVRHRQGRIRGRRRRRRCRRSCSGSSSGSHGGGGGGPGGLLYCGVWERFITSPAEAGAGAYFHLEQGGVAGAGGQQRQRRGWCRQRR